MRSRVAVGVGVALVVFVALGIGVAIGRARAASQSSPLPTTTNPAPVSTRTTTALTTATKTAGTPTSEGATVPPSTPAPLRYAFPVAPATGATYGRTHHDYPAADVFAPCGTSVVAPTSGMLTELRRTDEWSSKNDTGATRGGLSFTLVGDDGVRYYGSHLGSVGSSVAIGTRIEAGAEIGDVGNSGNAGGTACHLHFGISPPCPGQEWRVRRGTVYPQPFLDSWRKGGGESPSTVIARWASENPGACAAAAALPDAGNS